MTVSKGEAAALVVSICRHVKPHQRIIRGPRRISKLSVQQSILVLINEHKGLKEEIKSLKSENQELKSGVKSRDEQLYNFKNQIKISKIVDNINPEDGSVSELKKKVDDYIREIDKCIAYLSR